MLVVDNCNFGLNASNHQAQGVKEPTIYTQVPVLTRCHIFTLFGGTFGKTKPRKVRVIIVIRKQIMPCIQFDKNHVLAWQLLLGH